MEFVIGRDPLLHLLQQHLSREDEEGPNSHLNNSSDPSPAKAYLRERNAMASTAVDVKEYPTSYVFIADMPGLKSSDIKVTVETGNVLLLSGQRKKEDEGDSKVKYLSMERRALKFMRKFTLPSDADVEHIAAACEDGVLTVTVPKVPPPAPKVISVDVK